MYLQWCWQISALSYPVAWGFVCLLFVDSTNWHRWWHQMVKWHSKINLQKHEWMSCKKSYYQGYLWWWDFSAGKLWYGIVYGAIGRRYLGKILRSTNAWWVIRVKRPVAAMFLNASCVLTLKQVPANKRSSSLHLELVWRVSKTNSLAETEFFSMSSCH